MNIKEFIITERNHRPPYKKNLPLQTGNIMNNIYENLPALPWNLSDGRIVEFYNGYALIKQCANSNAVKFSNVTPKYNFHIMKLSACGRGWFNGRYDLPDNEETQQRFAKLTQR